MPLTCTDTASNLSAAAVAYMGTHRQREQYMHTLSRLQGTTRRPEPGEAGRNRAALYLCLAPHSMTLHLKDICSAAVGVVCAQLYAYLQHGEVVVGFKVPIRSSSLYRFQHQLLSLLHQHQLHNAMSVSTTAVALWTAASQWSRWTGCGSAVAAVGCMEAAR